MDHSTNASTRATPHASRNARHLARPATHAKRPDQPARHTRQPPVAPRDQPAQQPHPIKASHRNPCLPPSYPNPRPRARPPTTFFTPFYTLPNTPHTPPRAHAAKTQPAHNRSATTNPPERPPTTYLEKEPHPGSSGTIPHHPPQSTPQPRLPGSAATMYTCILHVYIAIPEPPTPSPARHWRIDTPAGDSTKPAPPTPSRGSRRRCDEQPAHTPNIPPHTPRSPPPAHKKTAEPPGPTASHPAILYTPPRFPRRL